MKKPFFDQTLEERLQQTTIRVRFTYCREKVNLAPIFSSGFLIPFRSCGAAWSSAASMAAPS